MKVMKGVFVFTILANAAMPAMAITQTQSKCDNAVYRRANPSECKSDGFKLAGGTIAAAAGGGAAIIGGALAMMGMSGGGSGSGGTSAAPMPTLPVYNHVGGDVDSVHLASIMNAGKYSQNITQYNEIRLAWSLARGFTGKNSTIAVLDAGDDSWHGATVAAVAGGPIAPDAKIETYKIKYDDFLTYGEIGEIINAAPNANIYNASWSVPMRANHVYSRDQIIHLTDEKFISALATAANRDAIFVWAAGNDYDKKQSSALSALPRVVKELQGHFINVVAWDDETGALANFSNACGITKDYCITAPGTNIAANNSIADGTSFAAPIVSAAVAVIREAFPYMTAPQITALLFETARDLGTPGVDEIYGHGMLDLERATRPVGAALVPIEGMATMQPLRAARVSGTVGHQIKSAGIKLAYFDKYGRAFAGELNDNIKIKNRGLAFDRLRGEEKIAINIGNFEMGLRKTELLAADGLLKTNGKNNMAFVAASNSFEIGNAKITQRTAIGNMRPRADAGSMISEFSSVITATMSVDAKIGDWSFGITMPDAILDGTMSIRVPTARAADGRIVFRDHDINLATRPALEYTVGYKFITAAFVDNPYGTDEIYLIAKKKIRF